VTIECHISKKCNNLKNVTIPRRNVTIDISKKTRISEHYGQTLKLFRIRFYHISFIAPSPGCPTVRLIPIYLWTILLDHIRYFVATLLLTIPKNHLVTGQFVDIRNVRLSELLQPMNFATITVRVTNFFYYFQMLNKCQDFSRCTTKISSSKVFRPKNLNTFFISVHFGR